MLRGVVEARVKKKKVKPNKTEKRRAILRELAKDSCTEGHHQKKRIKFQLNSNLQTAEVLSEEGKENPKKGKVLITPGKPRKMEKKSIGKKIRAGQFRRQC